MNKSFLLGVIGLAGLAGTAQAEEIGRVISTTPVIQQVAVPRQVCQNQPVVVEQPRSGAGSVMGAIAGGAMGNAIGDGSGRAVATLLGLVGGAMLGDRIEGGGQQQVQNVQQCTTQTFYENRATAYNVVYEYAGKQYQVQLPYDPGPSVRLQITPVGSGTAPADMPPPSYGAPGYAPPAYAPPAAPAPLVHAPPAVIAPPMVIGPPVVTVASPYPAYHYRPYVPPISLHLGYVRGSRHHHRHWR